jgi:signal transduction histidine kinase
MDDVETTSLEALLQQQENLLEVIESISSELELRPLLTRIVRHACELLHAESGTIALLDETRFILQTKAIHGMLPDELGAEFPPGVGLAGQVLFTRKPIVLDRYGDVPGPTQPSLLEHAVIGMPIFWKGELIGFFGLGSPAPRRFTAQDVRLLEWFARHTAVAIANARLFDAESSARAQAEARAAQFNRSNTLLAALGHVAMKFASAKDPQEVMMTVGRELKPFGVYCVVALLEAQTRDLEIHFASLDSPALQFAEKLIGLKLSGFKLRRGRWPIYKQLVEERLPVFVHDSFALSASLLPKFPRPLVKRVLGLSGVNERTHAVYAPLMVKSQVMGILGMWGENLLEEDIPTATVFAGQVAAAIENRQQQALLYERAQQLAVLEERRRLARDLHDSVTQLIFSMTLIAQSISPAWRRDPIEGEKRVNRLLELSQQTLVEMRALLAELRPAQNNHALDTDGLTVVLARHISSLGQDGIQIDLEASSYIPQPPALEENLFRIAQEALHNVVKHAHASWVKVVLSCEDQEVCLRVHDNGIGFWVDGLKQPALLSLPEGNTSGHGLGLANMRERATSEGGSLQLISKPHKGTTVEVRIPLNQEV